MIPLRKLLPLNDSEPCSEQEKEKQKLIDAKNLMDAINATPGETLRMGYDCPICRNKEFVLTLEGKQRRSHACSCVQIRQNLFRLRLRGLLDLYQHCTFPNFTTPQQWQQQAKSVAEAFSQSDLHHWFFLSGPSGCGKTHLCTAIAAQLILTGHDVQIFRRVEWAAKAKSAITDTDAYAALLGPLKDCDVLYLDDFLKVQKGASPTAADIRLAFEVLDARYNSPDKSVILSSEFHLGQITGFDEALAGRIVERSAGFAVQIQNAPGRNYRFAHV